MLQRRSENRLLDGSATLWSSRVPERTNPLPPPLGSFGQNTPYLQRSRTTAHRQSLCQLSLQTDRSFQREGLYGSGFPVNTLPPPIVRIGPYERLDLRADKSWLFRKWKLSLYGELLMHQSRQPQICGSGLQFHDQAVCALHQRRHSRDAHRWSGFRFLSQNYFGVATLATLAMVDTSCGRATIINTDRARREGDEFT